MQNKNQLENWYRKTDPWQYAKHPDDLYRKNFYLAVLEDIGPYFSTALDVGAGEGWITKDIPAGQLHALEISDTAAERLPDNIERVTHVSSKYDLVMATGVLYAQYDHESIASCIHEASTPGTLVFIGGIRTWLKPYQFGKKVREHCILYREYESVIQIWEYK
jgi:hypothetical protein